MEQIRQILSQLALHLELNIAMCDKIDDHEKRIKALEVGHDAQKTRVEALYTRLSEIQYVNASKAYEARKAAQKADK